MNKGQKIYDWIIEQHNAGRTVYATTYLRSIAIAKKHIDSVRVSGNHCEVTSGKNWVSINFCKITAS